MRKIALLAVSCLAVAQQPIDPGYTAKIREYTTEPFFLTELVDHLPSDPAVPTPEKVLGYVVGTPEKLTYASDVHRYMRELEKSSPRVRVISIGKSEEGRETILVAVSSEANMKRLDRLRDITARLADPRRTSRQEAGKLIAEGLPVYWASGSIHSPETGSPEMLMELAYRLAVSETAIARTIRDNSVVLMTPVLEVDGREHMVDLYRWRKANPQRTPPGLVYWGKYVAHDNNRDGMALSLALSQIVLKTFFDWHPQVLHDLHESVPFLYTSTGTGPYNAWLDPIVVNEWQRLAYHEIEELTKRGVPGVWTHGFYDGWAANYMVTAAQGHNSIGRFYETFGNGGADTRERTVPESSTSRTWFRPNPPLPKVRWSIRNNINLQQSALLLAMKYVADNKAQFLENFYLKSLRSVEKARKEGPAAWVLPADDPRPLHAVDLVNLLGKHGIESHRLSATVEKPERLVEGSYVIRMDQPYSRMADMLLDRQYYSTADPRPYDDTGWSLGPLRNIRTVRIADVSFLDSPMAPVKLPTKVAGSVTGPSSAAAYLLAHTAENPLATFRFKLPGTRMLAAETPFEIGEKKYAAGAWIIPAEGNSQSLRAELEKAAAGLGLHFTAVPTMPKVPTHVIATPRIALVHSWLSTQNEGWYRIAFDTVGVPYTYISDHVVRSTANLRDRFDVIVFGPTPGTPQRVVNGLPMIGSPIPWKSSDLTPNFATSPDQTDDIRGGMGLTGLANVQRFVQQGGLFVFVTGNVAIPIEYGLVEGVSVVETRELQARGSVMNAVISDAASPVTYGYDRSVPIYFNQSPVLRVSRSFASGGPPPNRGAGTPRTSGRGSTTEPDVPQGRPWTTPPPKPEPGPPGEDPPLTEEQQEQMRAYLPPPELAPRVLLRFAEEKNLLVAGMLAGGRELAHTPAVVDVPLGRGHILLFANNPVWRHQTQGSFFLLFNAMLHFDNLGIQPRPVPRSEGKERQTAW